MKPPLSAGRHHQVAPNSALQGDSTQMWTKDSDIALTLDSTLLILDDTRAVWPRHAANLLHAERYLYFPSCVRSYQVGQ